MFNFRYSLPVITTPWSREADLFFLFVVFWCRSNPQWYVLLLAILFFGWCSARHSQETAGTYAETAFFHKKTKTLLLTDAVLKVPQQPPEILASYGFLGSSHPVAGWYSWRRHDLRSNFWKTRRFSMILPGWWTQDPKILLVDCDFQNGCNMMQLTKWQRLSDLTFEEPFLKGVLNSRPLTAWCQNSQPLTWNTFCGGCPKEE